MQFNDIRKKAVGQIVWLQLTFKDRRFYLKAFSVTLTKRQVSPFELGGNAM